jgi:hypothetical protein
MLNKLRRNGINYELTITFQNSVNLGNSILVRILAWVVYHREAMYSTEYINFS